MPRDSADLVRVFGPESKGDTEEARAASSHKVFVRSQIQITEDDNRGTGRKMTALEALRSYGWDVLARVADEGCVPLVSEPDEPASTLKARRAALNLTPQQLARGAGVTPAIVEKAEVVGNVCSIRDLEKIAQALALNEHLLGFTSGAGGDMRLGVRLREMTQANDAQHFSATDVLNLTEAAWVVFTQSELLRLLNEHGPLATRDRFAPDPDYRYPTFERGYLLAENARKLLRISDSEPIRSVKQLVEETLGIPVIQEQLAERFAGATIANGSDRGIVINERGQNSNVWVRRMTIAHELGHLLWDPDSSLNRLKVDRYDDLQADYVPERMPAGAPKDPVEIRTNAFAISFLAPRQGVRAIASKNDDNTKLVSEVMETYGVSATATKHHIRNVTGRDVAAVHIRDLPGPSDESIAAENMAVDWFPLGSTPISRRGRFSFFVVKAFRAGLISGDTAAIYLRSTEEEFRRHQSKVVNAFV
jgi:Zn-dependent peptidase ImmA (M78 family)